MTLPEWLRNALGCPRNGRDTTYPVDAQPPKVNGTVEKILDLYAEYETRHHLRPNVVAVTWQQRREVMMDFHCNVDTIWGLKMLPLDDDSGLGFSWGHCDETVLA